MELTLDSDQSELQQAARRFVADHPEAEWSRLADLGWLGLAIPESHGGAGASRSDMAVIWCHRRCTREWIGTSAQPPRDIHYQGQEFMSRSTLVFHKEDGAWRVLHAHFSEGDKGPRPGGV